MSPPCEFSDSRVSFCLGINSKRLQSHVATNCQIPKSVSNSSGKYLPTDSKTYDSASNSERNPLIVKEEPDFKNYTTASTSPQKDSPKNNTKNNLLLGENADFFTKYKSVLPLIDADDIPYNIYGRLIPEKDKQEEVDDSRNNYELVHPAMQMPDEETGFPCLDGFESPSKHRLNFLPNVAESGKVIGGANQAKENNKHVKIRKVKDKKRARPASTPASSRHIRKTFYHRHPTYQESDQVPILTTLPVRSGSPLFDVDDAIDGASDAVRELLHTSDAIEDVMKNTDDDIEKALE